MKNRWRKQTIYGERGNCMAYGLAGLFDVHIRYTQQISDKVESGWAQELRKFCESRKVSWLVLNPAFQYSLKHTLYLGCGYTERGTRHCVVMRGTEMVFDPHKSNQGLKTMDEIWVFVPNELGIK